MRESSEEKLEQWIRYTLLILALVLAVLLVFLYVQYRTLRRQQFVDAYQTHQSEILARHAPLPPEDAGVIRSWMTFDYLNKIFALPPGYLRTGLGIADAHYPRMTVATYAKDADLTAAAALNQVENAVRSYALPQTATSTPGAAPTGTPAGGERPAGNSI
jgi:hypothetical protein